MNQGPLALMGVLHKILRHAKKLLMKYDVVRIVRVEDHLDMFYLHLQTLKVFYVDVACRLFSCTLDGIVAIWYHNLPPNTIQNWGKFKWMFVKKFSKDKTTTMFLKEEGSLNMEQKEKVKYFY